MSCIISGSSNTFKYGADGLRRQKTTNSVTTDYAYDSTMIVREGHASGGTLSSLTATYLVGARGPECRVDETQPLGEGYYFGGTQFNPAPLRSRAVTKWYVFDGLGSVVGEVDPSGNLTSSPKYDVYGAVRANGGTASSKQGFVGSLGHLSEPETGLVYMGARYYDPLLGRFANEDPEGSDINWYVYVNNNPITGRDATGECTISGELDYDVAGAQAGFGAVEGLLVIIGIVYGIETLLASDDEKAERTAEDIISSEKQGRINQRFPGEMRDKTLKEIDRLAKSGDKAAQTARKLLTNKDYDKGQKEQQ